jgi:hypothetical protein
VPDCCDLHADPRASVDPQHRSRVFGPVPHLRNIREVHRDARSRHDDQLPDLVQALELALAAEKICEVAPVDFAERNVLVLGFEHLDDAIDREVEGGDLLLRQLDANLPANAARHGHGRHSRNAFHTP